MKAGKARCIGASRKWAWQFMQALALQKANDLARCVSMQNHLHLLYRRTEDADRRVIDRVGEIAVERGLPRAQIALAWLAANPGVTAGATKMGQLDDAIAAEAVTLTSGEIKRLEKPYVPHAVAGFVQPGARAPTP